MNFVVVVMHALTVLVWSGGRVKFGRGNHNSNVLQVGLFLISRTPWSFCGPVQLGQLLCVS